MVFAVFMGIREHLKRKYRYRTSKQGEIAILILLFICTTTMIRNERRKESRKAY